MIRAHVEGKGEMMSKADIYEDIRAVKARYCRFLDTKNWQGLADLFTEDAVLDVREDTGMEPFVGRSEEHTSELQSLMRISYAVFCLKKTKSNKLTRVTAEQ